MVVFYGHIRKKDLEMALEHGLTFTYIL